MRRWFENTQLRRYSHASWVSSPSTSSNVQLRAYLLVSRPCPRRSASNGTWRSLSSYTGTSSRNASRTAWSGLPRPSAASNDPGTTVTQEELGEPASDREGKPEHWVALLEDFLPRDLSLSFRRQPPIAVQGGANSQNVLRIVRDAHVHDDVDILACLVLIQQRYKAAIHLADILLEAEPASAARAVDEGLPSNIVWPVSAFRSGVKRAIELDTETNVKRRGSHALAQLSNPKLDAPPCETALQFIWPFLADLVIAAARRPAEEAKEIMNTVHQIIARIHHRGLVPAAVYSYSLPKAPTTIQQPPILSLLTSRILSTLSDAVWRAYQDEAILRAQKEGTPYQDIVQDAPGGRFRLKVRELGPEVWMEFILWCCVEGGFASAGVRIVQALRRDVEDPWYAVHWTAGQGIDSSTPKIDWNRVRRRHGGTVGQIEGYSREKPFAEVPARTISAEVVLALVDCLINTVDHQRSSGGSSVDEVQTNIRDVVSFLEPHGLTPAYFDYLAVRFLQTQTVQERTKVDTLQDWASTISDLRSLQPIQSKMPQKPGLDIDCILEHSELDAGILHQALQAYLDANLITKAVDTFTDIQKLVDGSKLEAIGEFLSLTVHPQDGFFTSRPAKRHTEYIDSHGQLPMYKMPPLINMMTDAKLFGLGDWLLNSDDIDGPVIRFLAYRQPSVAAALSRYGAARHDLALIRSILISSQKSGRKPTVALLRALINSQITFRDWDGAVYLLDELRAADGGGYSPSVVANLAATILHLEAEVAGPQGVESSRDLRQAQFLLSALLKGRYDAPKQNFTIGQKRGFKQQVGFVLRLMENVPNSSVQEIALNFKSKFLISNKADLHRRAFHIFFSALVDTKGALEGRQIWDIFCKQPEVPVRGDSFALRETRPPESRGQAADDDPSEDHGVSVLREQQSEQLWADDGDPSIPFQLAEESTVLNPIVVPSLQTLRILVRGAQVEKEHANDLSEEQHAELDDLLAWAGTFARKFGLSPADIEAELDIPAVLPGELMSPKEYAVSAREARKRRHLREHNKLDVARLFTSRPPVSRQQTVPQSTRKAANSPRSERRK